MVVVSPIVVGENWIDCGDYFLNTEKQGTRGWLAQKNGRLSPSRMGAAIGLSSRFETPEEVALDITGIKPKTFTEESLRVMNLGTINEPVARTWYEDNTGYRVKEVGFAVPKWDYRIGGSTDGIVFIRNEETSNYEESDGIVEIKCPEKMYWPLIVHIEKLNSGWIPPSPYYHDHIWPSHYTQMQGYMKILNKKWCDYIVYSLTTRKVYVERIIFNEEFCNDVLCPGISHFLDVVIPKVMEENNMIQSSPIC